MDRWFWRLMRQESKSPTGHLCEDGRFSSYQVAIRQGARVLQFQ